MEMPSALAIAIAFDNKLPSVSGFLGSAAASSVFTGSGALPLSFFFDFFSMAPSSSRLRFFFPMILSEHNPAEMVRRGPGKRMWEDRHKNKAMSARWCAESNETAPAPAQHG